MILSPKQLRLLHILAKKIGMERPVRVKWMKKYYGRDTSKALDKDQAGHFIRKLEELRSGESVLSFTPDGEPFVQAIER
ncbi:MAG: hypothetical protein V1701_02765 [Planctomycetota bacterium]